MVNVELYHNLKELAQGTFPKRCCNCGLTYDNPDEFVRATQSVRHSASGLKQGYDDDGREIIELFRNCSCGSTLMDVFHSRRDISDEGLKVREDFDRLMRQLVNNGVEVSHARIGILKWLRGQDNELMNLIDLGK
jgi:hypothetical protein